MVAGLALVGVMPEVAGAEPMVLTTTQMDAITAAAGPAGINLNINVNIVTQIANARSIAIATCGICIGGPPVAFSLASASNANASQQIAR
jgi:hypothetical protein